MCGICGAVSIDDRAVDSEPVRAMLRAMVHRGPDAEGLIENPHIIDVTVEIAFVILRPIVSAELQRLGVRLYGSHGGRCAARYCAIDV